MKCAKERAGIFVAEQVRRLSQLERRVQQVVMRQFLARFLHHLLETDAFIGQPALQRARAEMKLPRDFLQAWALPCQQPLQNAFCLVGRGFLGQVLR
jgi:hypothetical protein